MIRRLSSQLPHWARPEHPILRHGLGKTQVVSRRTRLLRAVMVLLAGLVLLIVGYLIATGFLTSAPGQHVTEAVLAVVFWPVLAVQVVTSLSILALTSNTVSEEKRRQTWDSVRATEDGVELMLRTRWVGVFYRLRMILGVLMLVRLVLILGILFDLTAFRGGYLDRLLNGITPEIPTIGGVILLAFTMTGAVLLPITGIGLDASVGLLVSTAFKERIYVVMTQVFLVLVRVALVVGLVWTMTQLLNGELMLADGLSWLLAAAFAAMGDWGLALLNLGFYGELWATIPYAVFLGLGLLAAALLQALLTDWILAFTIHRAQRNE